MNANPYIEAFVLAGGKSSRMGKDKGLVPLHGRPMIAYVLKVLEELALPIKIIANKPGYESFGYPVVKDEIKEKGPMGGLYTAMRNTAADYVLLVGCDMPLISTEAYCLLQTAAENGAISVAAEEGRMTPLFALYPTSLKQKLKEHLEKEELKMTDFISGNRHILVTSIGERMPWTLQNINDQKDLMRVEDTWKHLLKK